MEVPYIENEYCDLEVLNARSIESGRGRHILIMYIVCNIFRNEPKK